MVRKTQQRGKLEDIKPHKIACDDTASVRYVMGLPSPWVKGKEPSYYAAPPSLNLEVTAIPRVIPDPHITMGAEVSHPVLLVPERGAPVVPCCEPRSPKLEQSPFKVSTLPIAGPSQGWSYLYHGEAYPAPGKYAKRPRFAWIGKLGICGSMIKLFVCSMCNKKQRVKKPKQAEEGIEMTVLNTTSSTGCNARSASGTPARRVGGSSTIPHHKNAANTRGSSQRTPNNNGAVSRIAGNRHIARPLAWASTVAAKTKRKKNHVERYVFRDVSGFRQHMVLYRGLAKGDVEHFVLGHNWTNAFDAVLSLTAYSFHTDTKVSAALYFNDLPLCLEKGVRWRRPGWVQCCREEIRREVTCTCCTATRFSCTRGFCERKCDPGYAAVVKVGHLGHGEALQHCSFDVLANARIDR